MNFEELRALIQKGEVDTVVVAVPDVFGRLVGKRFTARFFVDSVAKHGTHGCNYLLTVNIEMDPMDGFKLANWDSGFGDFEMRPDPDTIRLLPWQPGAALVICDFVRENGGAVLESPRSLLRSQVDALAKEGFVCKV